MDIFISWSGDRSKAVAEILRNWLKKFISTLDPWMSAIDIEKGMRWDSEISDRLAKCDFGIVCLTSENIDNPSIHFEAGALSKSIQNARICTYLLDLEYTDIKWPLATFQHTKAEKNDTKKLMRMINDALLSARKSGIAEEYFDEAFDLWWPKLDTGLSNLLTTTKATSVTKAVRPRSSYDQKSDIKYIISRDEFTTLLRDRLKDSNISKIQIISYTSEVDVSLISPFRISGQKILEVYKRSLLQDLAEEQECNLNRLSEGSYVRRWHKIEKSFIASEQLELAAKDVPDIQITQYLYDGFPLKRAYVFDEKEAIISYYEVLSDPLKSGGSVYKGIITNDTGIANGDAIHVTYDTEFGAFMLNETKHYIAGLRRRSRPWAEERRILKERGRWFGGSPRPCIGVRAVLFDMDGVLYDSLPQYVKAWKAAFRLLNLDFPEEQVYLQEGQRGRETILEYLNSVGWKNISEEYVEKVLTKKREVLDNLPNSICQIGARELVKAVKDSGLDIWVVTGSSRSDIAELLVRDFDGMIQKEQIITGRDVRAGKPNPDPYLTACIKARLHPHETIAIENAPYGIESASNAGVFCLAVNTGKLRDEELKRAGARVVFRSCEQIAENWRQIMSILK